MNRSIKKRIFDILEATSEGGKTGRVFNGFIITLILLNVIFVILETIKVFSDQYQGFFDWFETISVIIFTAEYLLRIWTCTIRSEFQHPLWGRMRFIFTPLAVVDLMAILPFYIPMIIPLDLIFLRALRLFRIFRIFRMVRYLESLRMFGNVMTSKKEDLAISFLVILIVLIISSTLIHHAEYHDQPDVFSSIPDAMWWAAATLTTVGYGDVVPKTPVGKLLGATISFLGIAIFALPAGILASGFVEEMHRRRKKQTICPHCGKDIKELLSSLHD